jgi:hypothetical protein
MRNGSGSVLQCIGWRALRNREHAESNALNECQQIGLCVVELVVYYLSQLWKSVHVAGPSVSLLAMVQIENEIYKYKDILFSINWNTMHIPPVQVNEAQPTLKKYEVEDGLMLIFCSWAISILVTKCEYYSFS